MSTHRTGTDLALVVALLASAFVYAPIRESFFIWDDFYNFLMVCDEGALRFIVTPMAGHMLYVRNAVLALSWTLFGLSAAPYFWLVLVTHLVNVWLLFRLVIRLTERPVAAAAVAVLWGTCPLHVEPLAWYAVFGQVLATTAMLAVLTDAAGFVDPSRRLSGGCVVLWDAVLLAGATSFGTGIAAAVTVPSSVLLLVPSARRPRIVALLAAGARARHRSDLRRLAMGPHAARRYADRARREHDPPRLRQPRTDPAHVARPRPVRPGSSGGRPLPRRRHRTGLGVVADPRRGGGARHRAPHSAAAVCPRAPSSGSPWLLSPPTASSRSAVPAW